MNIPKFRAWLKCVGLMKDVVSINFNNKEIYFGEIDEIRDDPLFDLDDVILMQSTGLTDKNGVEIYLDDVLKYDNGELFQVIHLDKTARFALQGLQTGKIRWFRAECSNSLAFNSFSEFEVVSTWFEIIGNIHANKELLK